MSSARDLRLLDKQISDLLSKKRKIEAEQFQSRLVPETMALVGTTYVYRGNSCGSDGKWDSYRILRKVVATDYHLVLIFEQHQVDCEGHASLEIASTFLGWGWIGREHPILGDGWTQCEISEYNSKRRQCLDQLDNPTKYAEHLKR